MALEGSNCGYGAMFWNAWNNMWRFPKVGVLQIMRNLTILVPLVLGIPFEQRRSADIDWTGPEELLHGCLQQPRRRTRRPSRPEFSASASEKVCVWDPPGNGIMKTNRVQEDPNPNDFGGGLFPPIFQGKEWRLSGGSRQGTRHHGRLEAGYESQWGTPYGGFHSHGGAQNGRFISMENPKPTWMINGVPLF